MKKNMFIWSLFVGSWIATTGFAAIQGKAMINGIIVARHIDDKIVTIQDNHKQVIYFPRRLLSQKVSIRQGQPVQILISLKEFKKLRIESQ